MKTIIITAARNVSYIADRRIRASRARHWVRVLRASGYPFNPSLFLAQCGVA